MFLFLIAGQEAIFLGILVLHPSLQVFASLAAKLHRAFLGCCARFYGSLTPTRHRAIAFLKLRPRLLQRRRSGIFGIINYNHIRKWSDCGD